MLTRTKLAFRVLGSIAAASFALTSATLAGPLAGYDRVMELGEPIAIEEFTLIDHNAQEFESSGLRGRASLVFFGFTNCADVCPLTMSKFQQLQASRDLPADSVNFVLISVDGERDTPAAMRQFLGRFSKDFIGLTGKPEHVSRIAKAFRASFYKDAPPGHDGHYSVGHSPQVFLLDSNGLLRAELYDPHVDVMVSVVRELHAEKGPPATEAAATN